MLPKPLQNTEYFFSSILEELHVYGSLYIMTVTVFVTVGSELF